MVSAMVSADDGMPASRPLPAGKAFQTACHKNSNKASSQAGVLSHLRHMLCVMLRLQGRVAARLTFAVSVESIKTAYVGCATSTHGLRLMVLWVLVFLSFHYTRGMHKKVTQRVGRLKTRISPQAV